MPATPLANLINLINPAMQGYEPSGMPADWVRKEGAVKTMPRGVCFTKPSRKKLRQRELAQAVVNDERAWMYR